MSNITKQSPSFKYRTDNSSGLYGVLLIRAAVGLPIGLVAAFVGNIVNGIAVPSPVAGDISAFIARMAVLGVFASAGGMVAWFNLLESRRGAVLVWAVGAFGGFVGAVVAYYIGDGRIEHPDAYILSQRLSQVVLLGSAAGATLFSTLLSVVLWRIGK